MPQSGKLPVLNLLTGQKSMASGINIYSVFQISEIIILDIRKRIRDIWKCIFDIQNTVILISDI